MIYLSDDLPDPLPMGQVRVKSHLPSSKENLLVPDDQMALFSRPVNLKVVLNPLSTCNIAHIFICSYFHICSKYQKDFKYHKCWPIPVGMYMYCFSKIPYSENTYTSFLVDSISWHMSLVYRVFSSQTCSRMSLDISACILCAGQMTDTCQMLGCRHEVMQLCQYG